MRELLLHPIVHRFDKTEDFASEFGIGSGDLLFCNKHLYDKYFRPLNLDCDLISPGEYGKGEPTDGMVDAMDADIKKDYKRIIAVGGGSVLDTAKLFCLETVSPAAKLFNQEIEIKRNKKLVMVPTTCGTGSEVSNVSILSIKSLGSKKGLATDGIFADDAVLIPELLETLPYEAFAASALDAFVHSVESSLSPRANASTRLFAHRAMEMILKGFMQIAEKGPEARHELIPDFLTAACYAGISFANAGNGAVHAMCLPVGDALHMSHGETVYSLFFGVMREYNEIDPSGEISLVNRKMADILGCDAGSAYEALDKLLTKIMLRRPLRERGMTKAQIAEFTDSTIAQQQRLLANNYVPLERDRLYRVIEDIF